MSNDSFFSGLTMTDITATINRYADVCKEGEKPSSDFVQRVLQKEAENVAL